MVVVVLCPLVGGEEGAEGRDGAGGAVDGVEGAEVEEVDGLLLGEFGVGEGGVEAGGDGGKEGGEDGFDGFFGDLLGGVRFECWAGAVVEAEKMMLGACVMRQRGAGERCIRVIGITGFTDDNNIIRVGWIGYVGRGGDLGCVKAGREMVCGVDDSLGTGCSNKRTFWEPVGQIGISLVERRARVHHFLHPKRRELFRAQSIVVFFQKLIVAIEGTHILLYL